MIDEIEYPLTSGSLFVMSPSSFHRPVFTKNTRLVNFMFTFEGCEPQFLMDIFHNRPHIALQLSQQDTHFLHILAQELEACFKGLETQDRKYPWLLLNSLLGKISGLCAKEHTLGESSVQYALLCIHNHFIENISLEEVAKIANYSPNYFSDIFKEYTDCTFKQYVINLRLSLAESLLKHTQLSIAQISERSGFHDLSNFMSAFKKRYGVTPKEYRVQMAAQKAEI